MTCSNAVKTRKQLKFAGVPQTGQPISAASRPKFTILWGHVRRYCCLTCLFPIVDICLRCEDIAGQSCAMVPRWRLFGDFLRPVFSVSRAQHVWDLHSEFALRPHHVWKYGRHPISEEKRRRRNHKMKIYMACRPALLHRAAMTIGLSLVMRHFSLRNSLSVYF